MRETDKLRLNRRNFFRLAGSATAAGFIAGITPSEVNAAEVQTPTDCQPGQTAHTLPEDAAMGLGSTTFFMLLMGEAITLRPGSSASEVALKTAGTFVGAGLFASAGYLGGKGFEYFVGRPVRWCTTPKKRI